MKKYLLYLVCFCVYAPVFAQHIDDAGFAQGIRYQCPKCIDSANNLTDAARIQPNLTVSLLGVADLKGIEGFSSLTSLNCTNSKLTSLPTKLPATLQNINVEYNQITVLPEELPINLRIFNCSDNFLTRLPATLPPNLRIFDCSHNQISALPKTLPSELSTLFCTNNLLTTLPPLPNKLEGLMCSYNKLKTLPLLPKTLIRLSCQYNDELKCLPFLPNNLIYLDISKTIVCVPNIVTTMGIDLYTGIVSKPVNLPICNDLRPAPCDTFPRSVTSKDTVSTVFNGAVKVAFFPNPTEGIVKIKCTNCVLRKVSVFNSIGQLVLELTTSVLDMSNLGTGLYIVQVETEGGVKKIEKIMRM
ncbi:MAG: T9SS type A sorting domain-containing protein [Saprospiraceae bacterium]|nr:T9SS type A sorting domain-containing protein [Saprospiraceae bacterium]